MNKIEITLPESFDVASRGKTVTVDLSKLNTDILARLALHGLGQKVSDSAANATKEAIISVSGNDKADAATYKAMSDADKAKVVAQAADIGLAWMQETAKNLEAGIWGATRVAGAGVTPLQSALRNVCRGIYVPRLGDSDKAKWKDMTSAERNAKLDEIVAKQKPATIAAWTEQAEADIAEAKARAERTAKLAAKLDDDITL